MSHTDIYKLDLDNEICVESTASTLLHRESQVRALFPNQLLDGHPSIRVG